MAKLSRPKPVSLRTIHRLFILFGYVLIEVGQAQVLILKLWRLCLIHVDFYFIQNALSWWKQSQAPTLIALCPRIRLSLQRGLLNLELLPLLIVGGYLGLVLYLPQIAHILLVLLLKYAGMSLLDVQQLALPHLEQLYR